VQVFVRRKSGTEAGESGGAAGRDDLTFRDIHARSDEGGDGQGDRIIEDGSRPRPAAKSRIEIEQWLVHQEELRLA
jgi:hypothetical protein